MPLLPTGTVTFLFADIEGSTRLLQRLGNRYAEVLDEYRRLLRAATGERSGKEIDTQGDGYFAVFPRATEAVLAAVAAQRALARRSWPDGTRVAARMAMHTGEPLLRETGYVGMDVHRVARICAAAHGGQILLSQTTRDLVGDDLPKEISLRDLGEHRLKDLGLPQHMHQLVVADLPSDFPPLRSLDALPNNLPVQLTSFIGRVREVVEVKHLLSGTRVLTLTGPGGCGKTRLAIQAAADLLDAFPDGVWWIEFAPLADPSLVPRAAATVLGLSEQPARTLRETLSDFLKSKDLLLVFDNCEHLVSACASLADALLRASPKLRIVVTSREPLNVAGELLYRVPSLTTPPVQALPSLGRLMDYEAIRLFVERAVFSDPRFEVTSNNAAAVAQACHRLDGIPLAIELAAARVKVLAVEQIARRLDDRFRLLTGGERAALPRHQTLRATLDWSYALLSEKERLVLARLSVFAGGWTLDAAEAVGAGEGAEASEMLDVLTQLVDRSLVVMEPRGGEARFRLLETVREYGRDKLRQSNEEDRVIARHRDFFLALVEDGAHRVVGPDAVAWFERLGCEHDNLRSAFTWSLKRGEPEHAARLAVALIRFFGYKFRGHIKEGSEWLAELAAHTDTLPPVVRAHVLDSELTLAYGRGDFRQAVAQGEEALRIFEAAGDTTHTALVCYGIGCAYMAMGEHARAAAMLDRSLALYRELGEDMPYAEALRQRGHTEVRRGNVESGIRMLEDALARLRGTGWRRGAAYALRHLGVAREYRGDHAESVGLFKNALSQFGELADKEGTAYALSGLGRTLRRAGDPEGGARAYRDSLALAYDIGAKWAMIECLYGLAAERAPLGRAEDAARLIGAARAIQEMSGYALPAAEQVDVDQLEAAVRRALGEKAFVNAVAAGRTMELQQVVKQALAPADDTPGAVSGHPARGRQRGLLTPREQEVATLVSTGLTNRQIAARLVITEKTVDAHVQNILNKLGAHSRTQIALWAAEQAQGTSVPR